jgi:hypothetical protein
VLVDEVVEYEVEDILDVRVSRRGKSRRREFLVKWRGYDVFDSTWEPESNLANCPLLLQQFLLRCGMSTEGSGNQKGG